MRFLYDHGLLGHEVLLLPGVAYQLRQFHGVMQHLARSAWIEHILRNPRDRWLLGASVDLEAFLFGVGRRRPLRGGNAEGVAARTMLLLFEGHR